MNYLSKFVFLILISSFACSNETSEYLHVLDPDSKLKISSGIQDVSEKEKEMYYSKLNALTERCSQSEIAVQSNPYRYMENEEYADFKQFVNASYPAMYYLLVDTYLEKSSGIGGPFEWMFLDITGEKYPDLEKTVREKIKHLTVEEQMHTFPLLYTQYLLEQL